MWPFKKLPEVTFEEAVKDKPMPTCGDKVDHYRWIDIEGTRCPACMAIRKKQQEKSSLITLPT